MIKKTEKFLISLIVLLSTAYTNAQEDTSKVKWLSFEETKSLFEKDQKPVLIYLYDKKNDSCNLMLNTTFGLEEVSNYINILFYPVKLDIFSRNTITFFDGIQYSNPGIKGSTHSLVEKLVGKESRFPCMVLFSKKAEGSVFQYFKDRDKIFPILIYYAESVYESTSYDVFEKNYFKAYPVGQKQIMTRLNLKWITLSEANDLCKQNPKKLFVNLYDNYSISSTMMQLQTYNHPENANYLNQNYYCINLNIKSNDTLEFLGQKFINEKATHGYHQLPIALLNGKMTTPAFVIFDENIKFIGKEQRYFTPDEFELLIRFVGENAYKNQKLDDYRLNFKSKINKETKLPMNN